MHESYITYDLQGLPSAMSKSLEFADAETHKLLLLLSVLTSAARDLLSNYAHLSWQLPGAGFY